MAETSETADILKIMNYFGIFEILTWVFLASKKVTWVDYRKLRINFHAPYLFFFSLF